jgi:hypothetical protein
VNLVDLLARLKRVRRSGAGYVARFVLDLLALGGEVLP